MGDKGASNNDRVATASHTHSSAVDFTAGPLEGPQDLQRIGDVLKAATSHYILAGQRRKEWPSSSKSIDSSPSYI